MGSGVSSQSQLSRQNFVFSLCIGTGGFSKVFSAMHTPTGKWYAIKEISLKQAISQKKGLEMIKAELEIMKCVGSHPYIAQLHYAFRDHSTCYMVFDLLTGADLRYHLRKKHQFSEGGIAFIIACISQALHHLHERGILHRDVKPENILLDENGFPYLIDYGVSFMVTSDSDNFTCHESSGTRQYLAPEVFTENHAHSVEADFWSLGVVMFELLFQKRPFEKHCPVEFIEFAEIAYRRGNRNSNGQKTVEVTHLKSCTVDTNVPLFTQEKSNDISSPTSVGAPLSPYSNPNHPGYLPSLADDANHSQDQASQKLYAIQREQFIADTLKQLCVQVEQNPFDIYPPTDSMKSPLHYPSSPLSPVHCTCNNQLYDEIFCCSSQHLNKKPSSLPKHLRVTLPSYSKVYGPLSSSCFQIMQGLLDVRLWERLGAGKNYQKLEQHSWFQEHSLNWIFQHSPSPAKHHAKLSAHLESHSQSHFVPCQQEINYDLCNKFVQDALDHKEEPKNNRKTILSVSEGGGTGHWTREEHEEIEMLLGNYFYVSEEKFRQESTLYALHSQSNQKGRTKRFPSPFSSRQRSQGENLSGSSFSLSGRQIING